MCKNNNISNNLYQGNVAAILMHNTKSGYLYSIVNLKKNIAKSNKLYRYTNSYKCFRSSSRNFIQNIF